MPTWLGWELEAVSSALTQPEGTQQTLHAKHVLAVYELRCGPSFTMVAAFQSPMSSKEVQEQMLST